MRLRTVVVSFDSEFRNVMVQGFVDGLIDIGY